MINKISKKQSLELAKRRKLKIALLAECWGVCMECHKRPDYKDGRGELHLSHTIPLSHGGKTDRTNCQLICRTCHNRLHGIIEK